MTRAEALDKIKKLLRMKRGGTQSEIETALALAAKIAREHGIDMGAVNPDEDTSTQRIGHDEPITSARIQFECKYAGMICQQFFKVQVFARRVTWQKRALTFVGTDWDRQIALYVYHFLVRHFRREWKRRRGRCRNRQAFMWGMYCGICSKLRELEPPPEQTTALVASGRALVAYIEQHWGKLTSDDIRPDGDAAAAKYRGYIAGRQTEIRKAVNSDTRQQPLLTI
jgi:hypothetical protein